MSKHKSEDYKISAVKYYLNNDVSLDDVCEIFDCPKQSLYRWVKRYEELEEIKRLDRKPISYKITKEQIKYAIQKLKENEQITMEELHKIIKKKYKDFDITSQHLGQVIRDNNITRKRTRHEHYPKERHGKPTDIKKELKAFYKEISKYKIEDIICIDETSIKSLQKRNHCYSQRGKRCVIKTQSQDVFKKYTGIFAISVNGVEGWDLYEKGGINTERLVEFLQKFITEKYKNKIIILDNASAHKNDTIRELVNKHNKLLYSVPYQHFSNAIENYFSMLKSKLQKFSGLKYANLRENITKAIEIIPKEYYKNIIEGAYNRKEKYIAKNKTRKNPKKIYL